MSGADSTSARMPNFFVIGGEKCGTTSLHRYLDGHPEIEMSKIKETHHFCEPVPGFPFYRVAGEDEYLDQFEGGTPMRGESSTSYSQEPRFPGVAARIAAAVPDAKLVYVVRDPIERARSLYVQRLGGKPRPTRIDDDDVTFEDALGDLDDPVNQYVCPSLYMTQIRSYLEHFPAEALLVVDHAELRSQRRAALREIFGFLGVDPDHWVDLYDVQANSAKGQVRYGSAYRRLTGLRTLRAMVDRVPTGARNRLVTSVRTRMSRPVTKPDLDPDTRIRLERAFEGEVAELRRFTGKPLGSWTI